MGALAEVMPQLAVATPRPGTDGLLDPAQLPAAWFAALRDAGCDRLLCRGIPWSAFPGSDIHGREVMADSELVAGADSGALEAVVAPAISEVYETARRRLAGAISGPLSLGMERDLYWLDATAGDRWGDAGELRSILDRSFRTVLTLTADLADGSNPSLDSLLVTSFRYLSSAFLQERLTDIAPASRGECLVMGHPSLGRTLRQVLPEDWVVRELFDIRHEDLRWILSDESPGGS